jgi:predicted kinase
VLNRRKPPLLVIVCGMSLAGKTTLGSLIAQRFGYAQVDVDDVKVRLYGVEYAQNSLDQDAWNRIYDEADKEISRCLEAGQSVVDASRNFRRLERERARAIAASSRARVLLVYVDTPESAARGRLLANRQDPRRVDWGDASFEDVLRAMEPPTPDEQPLVFHYRDDMDKWIEEHAGVVSPG